MNKHYVFIAFLCVAGLAPAFAAAQQTQMVFGGNGMQFSSDQKLMLEAAGKVMKHDYQGAETLYTQVISINGNNIDAYLQRGVARRELGNTGGAAADGQMAVNLADAGLQKTPNAPNLYYQRGMGYRLLKNYAQAKQDISKGMRLGGPSSWQTDVQAIDFEQKAGM